MTPYSSFFHLSENPFGETPDTRFFFETSGHTQALQSLREMVRQRKGFGVLTGEVGVGKTLLSRVFLRSIDPVANTALILYPHLNEAELISAICDELRIESQGFDSASIKSQLDRLNRYLLQAAASGKRTVLVIDEAQRLSMETLEAIRLLTNLETDQQKLLQIILIGQPELDAHLALPQIRQLSQRVSIRERLNPFQTRDAEHYIRHRIEKAGGANFLRFDAATVEWLTRRTGGIPRLLNHDCERLVRAAEKARTHLITRRFAKQVLEGPSALTTSLRQLLSRGGIHP